MSDTTDTFTAVSEADAIESLLAPPEDAPASDDALEDDAAEDLEEVEDTDSEDEVEDELDPDEDAEDSDDSEDEDFAEDDEEDAEEEVEETLYDVPVDGKIEKRTLSELIQSFSGQQYIQKGMKETAEQKKLAEETFAALQQQQAALAQLYTTMSQTGVLPKPTPPDHNLAATDPIGYTEALAKFNADTAAYEAQQGQLQQASQQQQQTQQAAMEGYAAEQRKILERDIPEYSDPEKGKALRASLRETGEQYGFTAEELSQVMDARTIKVLHDAMQFRKIKSSKPVVEAKAKKARPKPKPKANRKVSADVKKQQTARKRLRETGSADAAMELLFKG